jgi:hypothetical protein
MLMLSDLLTKVAGYEGAVRFTLVPQGSTFGGTPVNPRYKWEWVDGNMVFHVDCGGGSLDHHREGANAPSAAHLVDQIFGVVAHLPEWERLVRWASETDGGRGCGYSVAAVMRGMVHEEESDGDIFRYARKSIRFILANERRRVQGADVKIQTVTSLCPLPTGRTALGVQRIEGFGRVGVILSGRSELLGPYRNRLETEGKARLVISFDTARGHVAVMSRFPHNGKPVCLREMGIIQAIRGAEAAAWGIEMDSEALSVSGDVPAMKWFAHEVTGNRIANLFHGTDKVPLGEGDERTRLSRDEIVGIVLDRIAQSL